MRTVEGDIIRALDNISPAGRGSDHGLKAASRTDSGVSSLGNVVAFNTIMDDASLLRALNAVCENVHFLSVAEIDAGRNIRRADRRYYRYILPRKDLDVEKMRECAALFQGVQDFRRFCRDEGRGTVVELRSIEIDAGEVVTLDFHAHRFLWNMIRRIVAAIEGVGNGKADIGDVARALEGEDLQFGLADPRNLILMDVEYDDLDFRSFHDPVLERKIESEVHRARVDLFLHGSML